MLLVITISSLLLLAPGYLSYNNLSEIALFSTNLNLESDDPLDVQNHESDIFSSIISSIKFLPGINRLDHSYHLFSKIPSFGKKTPILRC